jgi:predicted regulator of Ras-like GTPase activity (Roadblock/LC7/MglB family)
MDKVLQQINLVPGVIGCLVCNSGGEVLANAFPPIFDMDILLNTSSLSVDFVAGLNEYTSGVDLIDLHCSEGRIVIKNMPKGFLLLLCAGTFNMQMLNIALNVAVGKLKAAFTSSPPASVSPALPVADQLAPSKPTDGLLQRDGKGFILTVDSLAASAKIPWDQMQEGVAISKKISEQICGILKIDAIKKIKLTNKTTRSSKTFSKIKFFERDNDQIFDDNITITLATAETMKVKPGDELIVEVNVGGGLFG